MTPRKKLRSLLAEERYLIAPGIFDPLSARLAELAGFELVYASGGAFSRAHGMPDLGLLSLAEVVHGLALAVDAIDIPLIADADTGYGNALNVVRTVREFERAGVSGFHIEDQVAPKKCGHYEGKSVVPTAEMVGKIKAAVDARRDEDLVVIARSDARAVEGLQAAIDRVNAYLEAGADVGFVEAPQSAEEMATVARELNGPALANIFEGGKTPALPARELEAMGFRLGIYPSQAHRAAIAAVKRVFDVLRADGDTASIEDQLATFQEREEAVDTPRWRALEDKYLRIDVS